MTFFLKPARRSLPFSSFKGVKRQEAAKGEKVKKRKIRKFFDFPLFVRQPKTNRKGEAEEEALYWLNNRILHDRSWFVSLLQAKRYVVYERVYKGLMDKYAQVIQRQIHLF